MHQYKILTITYKNITLSQLSDYIIPTQEQGLEEKLKGLKQDFALDELMYLLTCNRVIYFFVNDDDADQRFIKQFFSAVNPNLSKQQLKELPELVEVIQGDKAVKYLMEVASSLDSMVLGEREIPKQIRLAYEQCNKYGLTGDMIRVAVKTAIQTSKKVFTHTKIGHKPVSVVSLAAEHLRREHLTANSRFLVIGAGHTINLMSKFLVKFGFHHVTVFNRTLKNAEGIAGKFKHGEAFPLEELSNYKEQFDVIISCTGSTAYMVDAKQYHRLLNGDGAHKIVIDLAVPFDVDPKIAEQHDVEYVDIEKLREKAKNNLKYRQNEVESALKIIEEDWLEFHKLFKQRQVELVMREVSDQIKAVKEHAVNNVFGKEIRQMDPEAREVLEKVLQYVEKKYVSIPITVAKQAFAGK